jgi:phosphoribosylanthranilate isomerase
MPSLRVRSDASGTPFVLDRLANAFESDETGRPRHDRHFRLNTMLTSPYVKICCIASIAEAQQAILHGAAAVGFVSHMPSGPGVIADELIAQIAATVAPPVATFLLTSLRSAEAIAQQHAVCKTNTIQLVDALTPTELVRLRRLLPQVKIVQVIHVLDEQSVEEAKAVSTYVDALLLDSGNPHLAVKELGGTGRVHDWQLSRKIREQVGVPLFLAGGLKASNVAAAIATVQPFGIDLCSSVRRDGQLSPVLLQEFMQAVRGGSAQNRSEGLVDARRDLTGLVTLSSDLP